MKNVKKRLPVNSEESQAKMTLASYTHYKKKTTAFIAMGSNLGDRQGYLLDGLRKIDALPQTSVQNVSCAYATPPAFYEDQPPFLNAACEVLTSIPPHQLLAELLNIEQELGRVRTFSNAPRTLDLDLLLYGDSLIGEEASQLLPHLIIPHPGMHLRDFVLVPLVEIAPTIKHPLLGLTIRELYNNLESIQATLYDDLPFATSYYMLHENLSI